MCVLAIFADAYYLLVIDCCFHITEQWMNFSASQLEVLFVPYDDRERHLNLQIAWVSTEVHV